MPRKQKRKRRGRQSFLAGLSADQLMGEITRRRDVLLTARSEFESSLANVNAELAQFDGLGMGGVSQRRRAPGRPRGTGAPTAKRRDPDGKGRGRGGERSLATVLQSVLRNRTMTLPEMAVAAKNAGHKSSACSSQHSFSPSW